MTDEHFQTYEDTKTFLSWTSADDAHLASLGPTFAKHGPGITERFYAALGAYPKTAAIIDGRVDKLKQTHAAWMASLFAGSYGRDYFSKQYTIGMVHVTQNINPEYVDAVMSVIRTEGRWAIQEDYGYTKEASDKFDSLQKILDLTLLTINLAYGDERLERVSKATGMSRKLIENLVKKGGKQKG